MKIEDTDRLISLISKTVVVSLVGLGLTYLRNIGDEITQLNINFVQLRSNMERQNDINKTFHDRLEKNERHIEIIREKVR